VRPLMTIIATLLITVPGLGGSPAAPAGTIIAEDPVNAQRRICKDAYDKFTEKLEKYTSSCTAVGVAIKDCASVSATCDNDLAVEFSTASDEASSAGINALTQFTGIPILTGGQNRTKRPSTACATLTPKEYRDAVDRQQKAEESAQEKITKSQEKWADTKRDLNKEKNDIFEQANDMYNEMNKGKFENQVQAIANKKRQREEITKLSSEIDQLDIELLKVQGQINMKTIELKAKLQSASYDMLKVECSLEVRKKLAEVPKPDKKNKGVVSQLMKSAQWGNKEKETYWQNCLTRLLNVRDLEKIKLENERKTLETVLAKMEKQRIDKKAALEEAQKNFLEIESLTRSMEEEQAKSYARKQQNLINKVGELDRQLAERQSIFGREQFMLNQNLMKMTSNFYDDPEIAKGATKTSKTIADLVSPDGVGAALDGVEAFCNEETYQNLFKAAQKAAENANIRGAK
jgi:hypothetical protein